MPNRLEKEKSPYLLQHASNPVDWYAWGSEAFARARAENKPILLSVGYSTCHWCHVMERESFSDARVAEVMNQNFVCIKLDREERPDVDKIYMAAAMAMTGQGGWPLNVFLTPQLKPFYAGTYFPPFSRWGRPGWVDLLRQLSGLWRNRQEDVEADADGLTRSISQNIHVAPGANVEESFVLAEKAERSLAAAFDQDNKGFGHAPKFPMPANLRFLLDRAALGESQNALSMSVETLRAMGRGGIFDQLGGGFARYSTDYAWRIPHFEKMLYDNAQVLENLSDAVRLTQDPELLRLLTQTVQYLSRDLRSPQAGFYCAEDADSLVQNDGQGHASEGAFYLWTRHDVEVLLGEDANAFCLRYGVVEGSNALSDPHGEFVGRNVLYERNPSAMPDESAKRCREILFRARLSRPRPALDDKVLTSWNGLTIAGLARAYACTRDQLCLEMAETAADFIRRELSTNNGRHLWRRWRGGERSIAGMADDYAYLAYGLLELYCVNLNPRILSWTMDIVHEAISLFECKEGGLYQTAADQSEDLLLRYVEDHDGVEPAASSVLADVCTRLYELTGKDLYLRFVERVFRRFSTVISERPLAMPWMLTAIRRAQLGLSMVLVSGIDLPGGGALLEEFWKRPRPNWVLGGFRVSDRDALAPIIPVVASLPASKQARAYVCIKHSCGMPIDTPEDLRRSLDGAQ